MQKWGVDCSTCYGSQVVVSLQHVHVSHYTTVRTVAVLLHDRQLSVQYLLESSIFLIRRFQLTNSGAFSKDTKTISLTCLGEYQLGGTKSPVTF